MGLTSDGVAKPPCHSRAKAEWCDKHGSGGFMGHTCWGKGEANSQSEQPAEEKVERVFIPKTSVLLVEDLFNSLLKHYSCGSLLTVLAGLQEEGGNQGAAHAMLRILEVRKGTVFVEGESGDTPGEFVLFGAEGWVVENHQDVSAVEVTQTSEEAALEKGAVLRDGESVRVPMPKLHL